MMPKEQKKANPTNEKKTVKRPIEPVHQGPAAELEESDLLAVQRAVADPALAAPDAILALQRRYGNRTVRRQLVQRQGHGGRQEFQTKVIPHVGFEGARVRADVVQTAGGRYAMLGPSLDKGVDVGALHELEWGRGVRVGFTEIHSCIGIIARGTKSVTGIHLSLSDTGEAGPFGSDTPMVLRAGENIVNEVAQKVGKRVCAIVGNTKRWQRNANANVRDLYEKIVMRTRATEVGGGPGQYRAEWRWDGMVIYKGGEQLWVYQDPYTIFESVG